MKTTFLILSVVFFAIGVLVLFAAVFVGPWLISLILVIASIVALFLACIASFLAFYFQGKELKALDKELRWALNKSEAQLEKIYT